MKKTLVIMAAGMGSRFGGLKQIEPVGPNGEFIIDYSIYDAIKAGFNRVIFIIKKENKEIFMKTVGNRINNYIEVEYAFQDINDVPDGCYIKKDRIKPLGTAHAIYSIRKLVKEPFVVINADDFYGQEAYKQAFESLGKGYTIIGYKVGNTLSSNGSVKRGVCITQNNKFIDLKESKVSIKNNEIIAEPLNGEHPFKINNDTLVSMNMICLKPNIIEYIENNMPNFFKINNNNESEYLLPNTMIQASKKYDEKINVVLTSSIWYGMTYKEDKEELTINIKKLIDNNIYPEKLWEN